MYRNPRMGIGGTLKKYIIKNCPNCYSYGEHDYWCEFEHDNTLFTNPCQKSDCLLKQIANVCRDIVNAGFFQNRYGVMEAKLEGYGLASAILEKLEIEECENDNI